MDEIKFEFLKKIAKTDFKIKNLSNISKIDSVSPPSVFVGSGLKYPNMNVGILSPIEREEEAWIYDDCKFWTKNNFKINEIIKLRENLLNSRITKKAKDARNTNSFLDVAKEIAIASKPVDVEIKLKNRITFNPKRDRVLMPSAIGVQLENAKITSNTKIDSKVEKIVNDDLKATEGISYLYKNNLDEYALSKILSIGVLGIRKDRKLVPTRWSITATDDIISKELLKKIKQYKEIEDYSLTFGEFLGNQYLILFFPSAFCFELFELYFPSSTWNPDKEIKACTDFEYYSGRKEYASQCAGGYYATRLAISEYLEKIKRQAGVVVIRLETPSYWASLGVWVVRESVRKALEKNLIKFPSKEELIYSTEKIGKIKYDFQSSLLLNKSKIIDQINNQRRIEDFF